jgi:hypothetical protein
MVILKQLAELVLWFFLWCAIPAVLLYPLAIWVLKHTLISERVIITSYLIGVGLLFLPTGLVIDFLYRRFVRGPASNRDSK